MMLFLPQFLMHMIQGHEALLLSPTVIVAFLINCTLKVLCDGWRFCYDKGARGIATPGAVVALVAVERVVWLGRLGLRPRRSQRWCRWRGQGFLVLGLLWCHGDPDGTWYDGSPRTAPTVKASLCLLPSL
jgi:hypothetical protein